MSRILSAMPSRRKISIERADTWLHLTLGGSPARLISVTITSMPREARSMASVKPTGPPPTISTLVSIAGIIVGPGLGNDPIDFDSLARARAI